MPTTHFGSDLPGGYAIAACVLALATVVLLVFELRVRKSGIASFVAGVLGVACIVLAIVRPLRVTSRDTAVGARVVVLMDDSRSMALKDDGDTRAAKRNEAQKKLERERTDVRWEVLGFGEGEPKTGVSDVPRASQSDLATAIRARTLGAAERADAFIVISDGRLTAPTSESDLALLFKKDGTKVHTVGTTDHAPKDASVRHVGLAGAAVAHVPFPLRVAAGCSGGLSCSELTVTVRELSESGSPALLATGLAHVKDGEGTLDLTVTLDRAGTRILEVSIGAPSGDTIPENDVRYIAVHVARERVRVLHVAGRTTNDTRSLRRWLKGNASVDVVAFFILRTPTDNPQASADELSLIPFPVDELFREHLPSFDAVVLQDFDAQPYGLERHLPALASYVKNGGGLVMVGGPNSFVAGGYAGTPLAEVLPVELDGSRGSAAADVGAFVPVWTDTGEHAPLLAPLRGIVGSELPTMHGSNTLGAPTKGATALWAHPDRKDARGRPMPVLAIGERGNGRSIALAIDGTWQLEFSSLGASSSGRGYGALWDGLLGWLMRDPRFESASVELPEACVAGLPSKLRVRAAGSGSASSHIEIVRLGGSQEKAFEGDGKGESFDVAVPPLKPGGYAARISLASGLVARRDFACEAGGEEWADTRPEEARLRAIAAASGGEFVWARDVSKLPLPKPTIVSTERSTSPLAPPWVWTFLAVALTGIHWFQRRRRGLL